MKGLYDNKPIIACSTGSQSNAAIAVLRLSGFKALSDLQKFFSLKLESVEARRVYQSSIMDGEKTLDNICLTYFAAPKSYNGENILELSIHGNQLNIQNIMSLFTRTDEIRLAEAGEFTYRALLNGKLSLSQVEGLDLLLNANSSLMLQQGLETMHGELFRSYKKLHEQYIALKAAVELSIDFSEDVGDEASEKLRVEALDKFSNLIKSLHDRIQSNISSLTSPEVVLVGQTNAGKSSLFNALLKNNRSIVSRQAGTTRDFVSEYLYLDGVNYRLIDTAGLRTTEDDIEKEGIERSLDLVKKAFFRLLVVNPFETNLDDFRPLGNGVEFDLVVFSHADLAGFREKADKLQALINCNKRIELALGPIEPASPSTGPIGPVLEIISNKFKELTDNEPILIERHRNSINNIYEKLEFFRQVLGETQDIAIISSELNLLGAEVEQLIGIVSPEEVLGSIFSNFCIGK